MEILMASVELSPFTDESEAGQTVAGLSRTLVQLGHSVTVALPRYPAFEARGLLVARRLTPLKTPWGEAVTVFDGQLGSGVKLVLFEVPGLYAREGVYGEEGKDFADNARRFGCYAHAVAALAAQRAAQGQGFDVLHAHDFAGGLAALALSQADLALPKVVSVHDAARVGNFPLRDLSALGFEEGGVAAQSVRVGTRLHVLHGAVSVADAVTADAQSCADDLLQDAHGGTLAPLLANLDPGPLGILPGLDYAHDNPATDAGLPRRYHAENWEPKGMCKGALLRRLELDFALDRPLVLALGPLTKAAGFDVLAAALPDLLRQDLALVVTGDDRGQSKALSKTFGARAHRERDNYRFLESVDEAEQRRLLAAADLLLCPAPYDRVALSVRRGQRYGAVPIACGGGAVRDAVLDCDPELQTGTGFLFAEGVEGLVGGVGRGLSAVRQPGWSALVRRVMRIDHGWESPARRYLKVYERACV
jgi:starch synthase